MTPAQSQIILITGCSSGIGREAARLLAADGHRVYATARRTESVEELAGEGEAYEGGMIAQQLDVTDPANIRAVVARILEQQGRIDALVNNAAFGQVGTVEDVPDDLARRQFDANVFGPLDLIRAVLPPMRQARRGRIINVSSVAGHITLPLMGLYCASKHALNSLSDALRMEAAPFGISVSIVEPGPVATSFGRNALTLAESVPGLEQSAYLRFYQKMRERWGPDSRRSRTSPMAVAKVIRKAIISRRPRARYPVGLVARFAPALGAWLPDQVMDWAVKRSFGLDRVGRERQP